MGPTEVLVLDAAGLESALEALAGRIAGGRRSHSGATRRVGNTGRRSR